MIRASSANFGAATSEAAAAGSRVGEKNPRKWLWPALAGLIGTVLLIAQFARDTSSTTVGDPLSTPAATISPSTPALNINRTVQPTSKPAPTATVPKVVDRVRTEVSTQPIKFSVVRRLTTDLLSGQQRLLQAGINGERQIRAQVTTRDGREMVRRVLEVKVLKHSVPQIVLIGTRKATTLVPSSRSARPSRRVPLRQSGATTSSRYNRSNSRRSSTRRSSRRTYRRSKRRESSLPIVESPLP